ncbi:alpha/beta hydrolase [Mobilitalea sibirica]|uniref:Alpha/beta hydrolase n=1 Tax=Mobilitalea sibirica TaxID=1462919 RepID=A0A8J7H172_9FIRM|nr:alpha/beta hydrolase [Mobilitalea sibirica]MBH1940079.1 alpha/beta hydrolase [Mobilitalea sibirica]
MAINKAMRLALKALSYPDLDLKKTYKLQRQMTKAIHPSLKPLYEMWDHKIAGTDHEIPVRIFFPPETEEENKILIFFHGGGWVIGNIDSYSTVCSNMAKITGHIVVSVDYRLAPENRFPAAPEDCYTVAREIFLDSELFDVKKENITLIGDSAGGNLAAVVSMMARDRGEFLPSKQILIYPSTYNDHSSSSPFASVHENGTGYLLTSKRICDFIELYISCEEDLNNPYLAPLLAKDLSGQPKTLIITAEYDPLRDEGEAFGRKLHEHGNQVEVYRMKDALHGFISLPKHFVHVKRSYELINRFLRNED